MKFSTRTLYGLQAVIVLAARYGEGSLAVSQIAKRQGLSVAYLEQILNALKKRGFVKSVRGPQGGYVLSRKPSETTLKTLFEVLEPPRASAEAASAGKVTDGADEVAIANMLFWSRLRRSVEEGLGRTTLKDLVDEARRLKKSRPHGTSYPFHI